MEITQQQSFELKIEDLVVDAIEIYMFCNVAQNQIDSSDIEASIKTQTSLLEFGKIYQRLYDELLASITDPNIKELANTFVKTHILGPFQQNTFINRAEFFSYMKNMTPLPDYPVGKDGTLFTAKPYDPHPLLSYDNEQQLGREWINILKTTDKQKEIITAILALAPHTPEPPIKSEGNEAQQVAFYHILATKDIDKVSAEDRTKAAEDSAKIAADPLASGFTPDTDTTDASSGAQAYITGLKALIELDEQSRLLSTTLKKDINNIAAAMVADFNKTNPPYLALITGGKDLPSKSGQTNEAIVPSLDGQMNQAKMNENDDIIKAAEVIIQNSTNPNAANVLAAKENKKKAEEENLVLAKGPLAPTEARSLEQLAAEKKAENDAKGITTNDVAKDAGGGGTGPQAVSDGIAPTIKIDPKTFDDNPTVLDLGLNLKFDDPVGEKYFNLNTTNTTQLFAEDVIDYRAVQMVKPFFTSGHTASYFRLMKDSSAAASGYITSSKDSKVPTLKNPFGSGAIYNQFFIKRLDESHSEKFQLTDTLSTGQALFSFGEKPEFWTIQGQLINDSINNWLTKFREAWKHHLRISRLVKNGQFLRIALPAIRLTIDCYPVAVSFSHADESETLSTFSMQFFVKDWTSWSNINLSINDATTAYLNSMLSMLSGGHGLKSSEGEVIPNSGAKKGTDIISNARSADKKIPEVNLNPTARK